MKKEIKADDIIFNFFKQICDEKNDQKCTELGNNWIAAMEKNLENMDFNLDESSKIKHREDIESNKKHLNSLKNITAEEWRSYATKSMVEILDNKKI